MSVSTASTKSSARQLGDLLALPTAPAAIPTSERRPAVALAAAIEPTTFTFRDFWQLGFRRLVPIVPPDAAISERSSMAKRKDARGKAVGVKGRDGKWFGFDWLPHESTEEDIARWQAMGAGIGIKTGLGLVLIDADTLNDDHARIIRDMVEKHFGQIPARIGRYPKVGYPLRVSEPLRYTRIEFGKLNDKNQLDSRVEVLSDGRQFVAEGIHPTTGNPYYWPRELVPFDDLPIFPAVSVLHFLEELRTLLPAATPLVREGAETTVDQAALKGDLALVRKAVEATPNTSEAFPTRESYLAYGYALKASMPDEAQAFDIFSEWCARWKDSDNNPDTVEADWRRMKPPFRRGANWLYELAEQHAPDKFSRAEAFFQPIEDSTSPFDTTTPERAAQNEREPLAWIDPTKWDGQPLRVREWEVEGWVPKGEVTLLYGDGGVGKSLLVHQYATCAATGHSWLGQKTRPARVMCFFCEDGEDELHRRQHDINAAVGVGFPDLSALRLISRKHKDNLFALWDRHTGAMKRQAVWEQLLNDATAFNADVLIIDTIADTYSGSEIDRVQVNAFIKSCLGRLAQEIGGSVIALGHPSQAGKSSGQGTSGSTAWSNAARSRLYLRHPAGVDRGNIRELEGMKLNYGPKGSLLKLRWARGAFEVLAGSRPAGATSAAEPAGVKSVGDAAEDAVISVLLSHGDERLNRTPRSPYFAPKVLRRLDPDTLAAFTPAEVEAALERLERRKAIRAERVGRDGGYRPTFGYVVVTDNLSPAAPDDDGVFE